MWIVTMQVPETLQNREMYRTNQRGDAELQASQLRRIMGRVHIEVVWDDSSTAQAPCTHRAVAH